MYFGFDFLCAYAILMLEGDFNMAKSATKCEPRGQRPNRNLVPFKANCQVDLRLRVTLPVLIVDPVRIPILCLTMTG